VVLVLRDRVILRAVVPRAEVLRRDVFLFRVVFLFADVERLMLVLDRFQLESDRFVVMRLLVRFVEAICVSLIRPAVNSFTALTREASRGADFSRRSRSHR
jgi:hypothetical protein